MVHLNFVWSKTLIPIFALVLNQVIQSIWSERSPTVTLPTVGCSKSNITVGHQLAKWTLKWARQNWYISEISMTKWSTLEVRSSTVLSLLLSSLWPQPHTLPPAFPHKYRYSHKYTQIHTNSHKYTQLHTYTHYTSTNIYTTVDMSKIHSCIQIRTWKTFKWNI